MSPFKPSGTDRANRALLLVLALLFLAVGALVIVRGAGGFGTARARAGLLTPANERFVNDAEWFWPVVGVASALVAVLALVWLMVQAQTRRVAELVVEPDRGSGGIRLRAGALTAALEEELEGYRGVNAASARLAGSPERPHLLLDVTADDRADQHALRQRVETVGIAHARTATGLGELPVHLRWQLAQGQRTIR